ncbi:MAG: radical SAM protein, partial [Deltaproteobacteria bacterium]|nr:radical SAM protein [Deltaproteobacteria bacterium]
EELLKKTITDIENLGVPTIVLHGGEPMYRYDRFLRLVRHVRDDTCLWMFTTGYGVTAENAKELKDSGLFGVWVSLDHYEPEVHNKLRGNAQAFENVCNAVEHFKAAGVYTCLSLVPPDELLEPENFKRYYDFAKELGVAEIRVMERKPSGREACRGVTPHSPVLERLQKDLHNDPSYRSHPPLSGLSTWLEKDPAFGCQCRFEYLFITSEGDVQPCEVSEISFGNINEEEFPEIYKRICRAFPAPSTGCIPMVMYPEIREYQSVKHQLSSEERAKIAAQVTSGFQAKGKVPGAYTAIWSMYQHRLSYYRKRKAAASNSSAIPN